MHCNSFPPVRRILPVRISCDEKLGLPLRGKSSSHSVDVANGADHKLRHSAEFCEFFFGFFFFFSFHK
jgi:hypothetical protein